ncbi:hypothetical protein K2X92_06095 [Candidatus Gracilibacteria bacterium]|nr:hypothetical protein [Candidatus Gracilibacteria bacterium]
MSSKNKNVIKFAVGTPNDPQSSIWRLWVNKDDIYLGEKNTLPAMKVSLHASDNWRIAFVKELKREDETTDRAILKWKRPAEIFPGWTPSIAVLVSSLKPIRRLSKTTVEDKRIIWMPETTEGKRMIFMLVISKSNMSEMDARKILTPTDRIVGCLNKKNGEKVWLIYREDEDLTAYEVEKIKDIMKKTKIHLKVDSSEDSIYGSRAILMLSENTPTTFTQPTILDIALGKENLEIATE